MAYTSLREFAAAIFPKYSGESTTGVMKSTVSMPTLSSSIFQSAASSPLFQEAIRLSSLNREDPEQAVQLRRTDLRRSAACTGAVLRAS